MEEQKLLDYFKFDEADLSANRMGSLTEKQKKRLTAELRSTRRGRRLFAVFMFFIALIGVVVGVGIWFFPSVTMGMKIGFAIGFGLVWPLMYGLVGMVLLPSDKYESLEMDRLQGRVNIIRVESHDSQTGTTSSRYDLYIGSRRFLLDSMIGGVMVIGDEYTVYFLKYSNKIVSAEFVSRKQ